MTPKPTTSIPKQSLPRNPMLTYTSSNHTESRESNSRISKSNPANKLIPISYKNLTKSHFLPHLLTMSSSSHFFLLFFLCFFKQIIALTHPSDISALKAFKSSINPTTISPYSCLASWDFSVDPCSLPHRTHFICGISCTNHRVTSLVLDPVGYSGPISPLLSSLSFLTHLDLSDNSFHGSIPPQLSQLTRLETLSLRSNSLSGPLPSSLTKLVNLHTLEISHNALTGALPTSLSSLTTLRTLDLSFNRLTGSLPKLPPNLVEFALKANLLSGSITESSFHGLSQLEVVELADNMLTGALNSWFFLLPRLQQVDLSNNSFTSVTVQSPASKTGSELVAVDLSFNKMEGYLPATFAVFPLLSSLSVRYNKLRGPIPWQYGNKASFRRLFLDGNFLNGKAPTGFFSSNGEISGSFGDNCLESCPLSSHLCSPTQKSISVCKQVYGKKPKLG